ncbi:MAG: hypothetical protein M1827_001184 [Pycnora praestabilis]|nr:MAG: hypothetical protein M1827_001184 [Pycnora praestabilis]
MASNGYLKRKQGPGTNPTTTSTAAGVRTHKRAKIQDARTIAVQTSDKALNNGQLDVDKFVKAREYEIRALEAGLGGAKKALRTRAFQSVPRDLRRRTASHNVKKVPKRLRGRAKKEMAEDNTPTVTARRHKPTPHMRLRLETAKRLQALGAQGKVKKHPSKRTETDPKKLASQVQPRLPKPKKNTLGAPPKPVSKFRKRQIHKSWLPTHLFHAKRAHMTSPKEPLWRFAIPLTPTAKSYRPTHRVSGARGAIAWDTSYMATIGIEGPKKSIQGVLKAVGVDQDDEEGLWGKKGEKWEGGRRSWEGWMFHRDGWPGSSIAPVLIVWCAKGKGCGDMSAVESNPRNKTKTPKEKERVLIRVHPSSFLELWEQLLKMVKQQNPPVMIEDLRFEIGSIEVTGPASTEALVGSLRPNVGIEDQPSASDSPESTWNALPSLTNPASLPPNALLGFSMSDPRLHYPPRTISHGALSSGSENLLSIMFHWTPDATQTAPTMFDRTSRLTASRCLPSQKAINRRKSLALPGAYPDRHPTDPQIPTLLLTSHTSSSGGQGTWIVLLPWKCVLPVWYSLVHYPLSSGGCIRFGGLREKRQLTFEAGVPWFPGDFPGTKAGWLWEMTEREKRKAEWDKRPKGKRTEWTSLDLGANRKGEIGLGWACDWERLVLGPPMESAPALAEGPNSKDDKEVSNPIKAPEDGSVSPPYGIFRIPSPVALKILTFPSRSLSERVSNLCLGKALTTVKISILHRGSPTTCARIYRLPTKDPDLTQKWLSLAEHLTKGRKDHIPTRKPALPKDAPPHVRRQHLAASFISPIPPDQRRSGSTIIPQAGDADYPIVPGQEDLIGFVTTGNFNLGEGKGIGIGCLALGRVKDGRGRGARLCIVREAGQAIGRLGRWEIV